VFAVDAIHAALGGIGEHVLLERSLTDFFGNIVGFRKRLAGLVILCEFDAE